MAGILIATSAASAAGLDTYPGDPTEAEASIFDLSLNGTDLIGLASSHAGSVADPGPNREAFAGSILGGEIIDFGAGYTIPLDQFIDFGQAGVLLSESTATDGRNGEAISGIAGADGGLTLDGADGEFGTATVDLLSLFTASGVDGLTDIAIDQADFSFGLGGAWVEAIDGVFQDPDAIGGMGQYRVGDAKIVMHSPVIEQAAAGFSTAAGQMEQAILDAVNPVLALGTLLPGATIDTTITSNLEEDVLNAVLLGPITTDDGLASIDIGAGTVTFDIGRFGGNDDGIRDPSLPTGINNQNPNTELIDSDTYPFIASSIHDVIEKVIDVAVGAAIESLQSVNINFAVTAVGGTTAGWDMNLAGTVTNQFCNPAGFTGPVICATINTFLATVPGLMAPVLAGFTDPNSPLYLYNIFTTIKTDLITVPIRAVVDPFLEIAAQVAFSVQLNHQETQVCTPPGGGADQISALEVSALSFGVGGGLGRLGIGNAGVRVDACNLAGPALSVSSPVPAGGSTDVTSSGWAPNAQVSLQLTSPQGDPVGSPVVVTADGTGTVPAGTVVPVPADAPAGEYTVVGSAPGEDPLTANLTVYAPTLEAQSPVAPADCSAITSTGWLPNSPLTLQLENATGDPVGAPVAVTTDANGAVPAGTCVPIPADAPEGDYTVVGTDGQGTERTDTVTVQIGAITPTLSVTSPVPAGGETTVTSGDWNPNSPVSFQLTAPNGDPVGNPVDVTTDGTGTVPSGTTVPVPADAPAGDYTVVGTDPDDNTISAPLTVYAPTLDAQSPVAPGVCSAITSDGWLPNSPVTFQLRNATGDPVGAPVAVTTDANGVVPAGTCVQVPADAPEGDYDVLGTDGTAEVTDPVVVDAGALAPTLAASSPVPAGGETTVTSDGWNPASEVSLQLTAPNGDPVGAPVVVTTDGNGALPAGTTVPVPADAPAGDYTVVGTDPDGNNATGTLAVYAPALSASTPVPAGGSTTVTSTGWLPNTPVTLQLTDPDGNPLGDPVPVTTDANGDVPDGTTVPVPLTADPGTGYSVVGTDANGAEATGEFEVTAAAITPTLDASSPVPAGGETTVVSGGWVPGSQVSLQLENGAGDPVGAPVLVMTDGDGDVPTGTTVPVPADAPAGDDYSVVGTDLDGNEASDVLTVYAPVIDAASPVPAGGTSAVTSTGWLPDSAVTLQLTNGAGAPVGDPVPVTADGTGALPSGTTVPVPAGTTPGADYEVVGTDANGVEVSDTIEVTAAGINPTIDASSPVPAGGETTVTSSGWNPASEVSLQLTAPNGDPAGAPVVVTTDGDGALPEGTTVPVPADASAGGYTVVATDPDDVQVSDAVQVYAPTIDAASPVPAGGTTAVTSPGWLPNSAVELQLLDPDGNPLGDPVPVTTDAEGDVPDGTTVPVPLTAAPGPGYSVVGTDANGAEASDVIEVTAAVITPTLDASSPVPAGGETTVTSGGWIPGSQVSLQLADPDGDPVGAPVQVMADGDGDVPTGTTVQIPADAVAGEYTVVGTDADENTASDTLAVYAPALEVQSPVAPGTCALVESGGWLPNTPVTLQLTEADGTPVGAPVTVTADANGDLPAGTCVTIPEGTPEGDYEVVGTDDNGAEVTAPVAVDPDAINPTITATSPVPAGGETTVDSDGWNPDSQVTLQLVDPAGNPLGDPVEVTTGGDGSVPDGTTVPVPLTAAPGEDYWVTATDEDGVEVSAPLEVTAAVLAPTLSASSPAPAGGETTIQSTGWVPGSDISLQLTDGLGAAVGEPVEVTADPTGAVPAGTTVEIPRGIEAGGYTVAATDEFGNEASGPLDIYAPSISASSPVVAGDATEVTSTGWLPNTEVALELQDAQGAAIGEPVTVMTDGDGAIPDATTVPVPESTPAGTEYFVVGTDENGAEVADQIEVLAAGSAPTLQASSPVPAGGESAVTSGGWEPGATVTLQLTDAEGAEVGEPVIVTADGDGNVPDGTTVPVPADATAGAYEITGTDGDSEASAPLAVYAPAISATSPVPAGGSTTVTSTGWMPNTEVTLQLTDAEDNLVGEELTVMSDGAGAIPAGTTLPVPADAPVGAYSVVGTDANGAEVSAAIEVTAAGTGPTLSATSPVPAGGETTVTSTGWEPAAIVSLQLTIPAGDPVGEPVVVTAGGDGSIPAGTAVPVPEAATAGTYSVVGTDEDDNTASAALAVYAPRLLAASPVPAGGSSQITSDGWMPNSTVTLQLVDSEGEPVGEPVTVNANGAGALPAGTSVPVPAAAAPGDYTITAVDQTGAALEAALAVTAATAGCANPAITVNPTAVAPGKTVAVTGTGFAAGSTATVQLYDAKGKALLDPALTLEVGASCGFTITVKVPAGAAAGTYKIVGTDDTGNAASADLTVTGGAGGGLAATGGDPGVHIPLAIALIAIGTAVLLIRRPGVVADKQ
ncbi:hypothetical protein MHM582_2845 [Microbacterium sp. HM58-2]|nr:hypothetical protein MHM582_2845 [Microbacterium sp. HM58-2]